jgi:hypothetical protein
MTGAFASNSGGLENSSELMGGVPAALSAVADEISRVLDENGWPNLAGPGPIGEMFSNQFNGQVSATLAAFGNMGLAMVTDVDSLGSTAAAFNRTASDNADLVGPPDLYA